MNLTSNPDWLFRARMDNHQDVKDMMLAHIDQGSFDSYEGVSKVDHRINKGSKPPYYHYIKENVSSALVECMKSLSFDASDHNDFEIHPLWFQQYEYGSSFTWHSHDKTLAFCYYCELPNLNEVTTEMFDPFTNRIFSVEAEEGDIIIFPSFINHRSPPNKSGQRKTVIAGNVSIRARTNRKFIESTR